jgi:hypothetical protein
VTVSDVTGERHDHQNRSVPMSRSNQRRDDVAKPMRRRGGKSVRRDVYGVGADARVPRGRRDLDDDEVRFEDFDDDFDLDDDFEDEYEDFDDDFDDDSHDEDEDD